MRFVFVAVAVLLVAFGVLLVSYGVFLWLTPDPEGGRRWFGDIFLVVGGVAGLLGIGMLMLARRGWRRPRGRNPSLSAKPS